MDDGSLVPVRPVEHLRAVVEGLLEVPAREDDPRAVPVPRVEREPEVALLVAGGHPRGRAAALVERDHEGDLVDPRPSDPLHHQAEAGTGRARRGPRPREGGADRHRHRGDLVLRLHHEDGAGLLGDVGLRFGGVQARRPRPHDLVRLDVLALVRGGRDRVVRLDPHPSEDLPEADRLGPRHQGPLLPFEPAGLEAVRVRGVLAVDEVVRLPRAPHVHLRDLRLRTEDVPQGPRHHLVVVLEDPEGGGDREHVHHPRDLRELVDVVLVRDLVQELGVRDGDEGDTAVRGGLQEVLHGEPEAAGDEVRLEVRPQAGLDRRHVVQLDSGEPGVVHDRPVVHDVPRVAEDRLRVEGGEEVEGVDVGADRAAAHADLEVRVVPHDVRVVLPVPVHVEAAVRGGPREHGRGRVHAAPLGAAHDPRELIHLQIRHRLTRGADHIPLPSEVGPAGGSNRLTVDEY